MLRRMYHQLYPSYHKQLCRAIENMESILDVGCGSNSPLQFVGSDSLKVGLDVHPPSIEASRSKGIHDRYVEGGFKDLATLFEDAEFDCVIANDVIEHLSEEDGYIFIRQLERIAKRRVIIFTPTGFVPQAPYMGNQWMAHISGWEPKFFARRGYRVRGVNGWKKLRGERKRILYKPANFFKVLSWISQYVTYWIPSQAFAQFAVLEK